MSKDQHCKKAILNDRSKTRQDIYVASEHMPLFRIILLRRG